MSWPLRLSLTLATLLGAVAGGAAPEEPANQALRLVEAYNARSFGNPGWRRVRLELKSGSTVTRGFTVVNVWQQQGRAVRTLFLLERPDNLRGTNYLLTEDPDDPAGMKVFLHLPAGRRRVLSIQPSHFDEGLLGSDFGYRDLRMKIPTAGFAFRLLGRHRLLGRSAWAVEARPASAETRQGASWERSVYYLAQTDPILLGADHFRSAADPAPAKRMRVHGVRRIDGAWTETLISMTAPDGRSSVLSLVDFRAAVADLDTALFSPEVLPVAAERLFRLQLVVKPRDGPLAGSRP
jgi:outer membrane lipoprotein-sorting protein